MTATVVEGPLTAEQADLVLQLAAAARTADGVAPLSEQTMLHIRHGAELGSGGRDWLVTASGGGGAGYAHLEPPEPADLHGAPADGAGAVGNRGGAVGNGDGAVAGGEGAWSGELVVHPAHRRRGHGTALVAALADAADGRGLRIWAHGDLPAAAAFAKTTGFTRARELWQMLMSLRDTALPQPVLPAGVTLRTFVPGSDDEEWLAVNRRAFAHHPEQGGWTRADLELREAEPWFDPAGFFLAERSGKLVGFHWTKVHPSGGTDGGPIGEVYVVGVDPRGQGGGLGKALTIAGLAHLRGRGLAEVMLYVDGDNTPAARLYESLGFTRWHTDVMYQRGPR